LIVLARMALGLTGPSKKSLDLAKKKVNQVQRLVKPGSRKPTGGTAQKTVRAAENKLKATGTTDDAAEALIARRNARSTARRRGRRAQT